MVKQKNYAVIDVETTGTIAGHHRITEIAVFVHDGKQVIDEFSSLVNPGTVIPYGITQLTGITNGMVESAPSFAEVASRIVELTKGRVFVAHNAAFDYRFLRSEFQSLGYPFKCPTLCTVRMSRRLIPGLPSYSLGNLCQSLGIPIIDRHRAAGDARATVTLLEKLMAIQQSRIQELSNLSAADLGKNVDQRLVSGLPDETGVYYFRNPLGEIIYIGKSRHIRSRVISHLSDSSTKKALRLKSELASVDFEITGSELVAQLKESEEIKRHNPPYNRAQRRKEEAFCICPGPEDNGYCTLCVTRTVDAGFPLAVFSTLEGAREHLFRLVDQFGLCQTLCGLQNSVPCFSYQLKTCLGACLGLEERRKYNARVTRAMTHLTGSPGECLVLDRGRTDGEYAVIRISRGKCLGYGYVDACAASQVEAILDSLRGYTDTRDSRRIIRGWLRENPQARILDCGVPSISGEEG